MRASCVILRVVDASSNAGVPDREPKMEDFRKDFAFRMELINELINRNLLHADPEMRGKLALGLRTMSLRSYNVVASALESLNGSATDQYTALTTSFIAAAAPGVLPPRAPLNADDGVLGPFAVQAQPPNPANRTVAATPISAPPPAPLLVRAPVPIVHCPFSSPPRHGGADCCRCAACTGVHCTGRARPTA